uniref:p23 n=1 Tax=Grapevine leafroll-associated virus Carn TaxID=659661 RepID=D2E4B2_9VIRU|nr:p23 [Grapevine leafroll-associated virus Carn]
MECILVFSKRSEDIPLSDKEIFFLREARVYAATLPPERLSFFYDKLDVHNNTSRENYKKIFDFLDNLGNVVATNSGAFMKFLTANAVDDFFKRKYPNILSSSVAYNNPTNAYCFIAVPALERFISSLQSCELGLITILAVGFSRNGESDELWDFKNSFVVFEHGGSLEVFYGDSMDTRNSAILEIFNSFKLTSGQSDIEKVVNLLSI